MSARMLQFYYFFVVIYKKKVIIYYACGTEETENSDISQPWPWKVHQNTKCKLISEKEAKWYISNLLTITSALRHHLKTPNCEISDVWWWWGSTLECHKPWINPLHWKISNWKFFSPKFGGIQLINIKNKYLQPHTWYDTPKEHPR